MTADAYRVPTPERWCRRCQRTFAPGVRPARYGSRLCADCRRLASRRERAAAALRKYWATWNAS